MANHLFLVLFCLSSILIGGNSVESLAKENSLGIKPATNSPHNTTTASTTNSSTSTSPIPTPTTKPPSTTISPNPPSPPTPTPPSTPAPSSSTTHSSTTTSTTSPTPSTTPAPKHDRSFDLPSFIGGVILSLGLAAIGYVVYKFYKTRTENYRTL